MARDEFIDENLPWPVWRPIVGTLVGAILLAIVAFASPIATTDTASALGGVAGRTAIVFAILYFPAYSRRGWPWRLAAFALLLGVAWFANAVAANTVSPPLVHTTAS